VTGLPLVMRGGIWGVTIPGREVLRDGSEKVGLRFATRGYFPTLGIPLKRGRDFNDRDGSRALWVAVVSERFAQRHWPGEDPIGKQFSVADSLRTIVGVVGDIHVRGLERTSEPQLYLPPAQVGSVSLNYIPKDLVVLATRSPMALIPGIREIVKSADVEQPLSHLRLLSDIVADETAPRMTQLRLLAALSVIALLIAGIGIHGLLMFTVSQRSQELGVRRALGAQAGGIVRLVLREGLVLTLAGIAIGVPAAYGFARGMSAALSGIRPEDPPTMVIAAVLCFATALAGCVRPATKAARVDPMSALRSD
jgi:putative ABC transport system permease protein